MSLIGFPLAGFIPRVLFGGGGNPNFASSLIDATDEGVGCVFPAPKAGNIRQIGFTTGAVTTTGDLDCRLETASSAAPALPSGTLFATDTRVTKNVTDTQDNVWIWSGNLIASAAVTKGQVLCAVVVRPSGSAFVGNVRTGGSNWFSQGCPYSVTKTGASWAASGTAIMMAIEYDDGTVHHIPGAWPIMAINQIAFNNASAQDEVGQTFVLPFAYRITGFWLHLLTAASADFTVALYDESATPSTGSALTTFAVERKNNQSPGSGHTIFQPLPTEIIVPPNTIRRLMVRPTTGNNVTVYDLQADSALCYSGFELGEYIYRTSREKDSPGAWDEHSKVRRLLMGLEIDGIETGSRYEALLNRGLN